MDKRQSYEYGEAVSSKEYIARAALYVAVCALSVVCVLCISPAASPSSFKGYSVLFVDRGTSTATVESLLKEAGCTGVIDENSMSLPLTRDMLLSSPMSDDGGANLVTSMAVMNDEYLKRRGDYFVDSNGEYSLYYLPLSSPVKTLSRIMKGEVRGGLVQKQHKAGCAVLAILTAALLCIIAKSAEWAVLPAILAVKEASAGAALACILVLCAMFAAQSLWERRHSLKAILIRGVFPILLAAAIAAGSIGGFAIPVICCILGSLSAMRARHLIKKAKEAQHFFNPVPILTASSVSSASNKGARHEGLSLAMGAAVCVALSLMGGKTLFAPSGASEIRMAENVPGVDDYCKWCWQCLTYPYTRLGEGEADAVLFPTYREEGGVITEEVKEITADGSFRSWCIDMIDKLPKGEVEHLMKARTQLGTQLFAPSAPIFPVAATAIVAFACAIGFSLARRTI